mmetsp:Transcript_3058/g.8908  ORF Transcript_3058/g.8908 Transcript_3058/m.8908 type:complete len:212 (-) Transcript_3058:334-969(-)
MGSSRVAAAAAAHTKGEKPKRKNQPVGSDNRGGPAGGSGADGDEPTGILYIGHLPHGFYEKEMKGFFGQFGAVKNVRLSRSRKTAKSKGYAWLQFREPAVAPIAAQAMDGYMMYSQKLQVHVVTKEDVHPELFKGANTRFKEKDWRGMAAEVHNATDRTAEQEAARLGRALKRDRARQKAIADSGIDYSYDGLAQSLPKKAKRTVFAADDA